MAELSGLHPLFGIDLTGPFFLQIAIHPGQRQWHSRSERVTGRCPSESVAHAASRLPFASSAFGLAPIGRAGRAPSKQSRTGERWTLPPGNPNSVMPVSQSSFGAPSRKPRLTRFLGAFDISPLYELYLAFFLAYATASPSSRMMRRTAFSDATTGPPPDRSSCVTYR